MDKDKTGKNASNSEIVGDPKKASLSILDIFLSKYKINTFWLFCFIFLFIFRNKIKLKAYKLRVIVLEGYNLHSVHKIANNK